MKNQKGFTLIELMIVIAIIAIIAAIAIPNLLEARKGANESAAISTMRTLVTVQALYRDTDKDGDGQADFATTFTDLFNNGQLIDDVLSTGIKQGYSFTLSGDGFSWSCVAVPQSDGKTGDRRFFVDDTGVIRFTSDGTDPDGGSNPIGG